MRQKSIETIVSKAEELATSANNLLSSLARFEDGSGQPFDVRKTIRSIDSSVSQIVARIQSAVGIIAEFGKATRADLVPALVLSNLQQSITDCVTAIDTLIKLVENLVQSQGGLLTFNYTNFHAQTKNGQSHNMEGQFLALFNASETFLQRFFESLYILKPRASYSFQAAASGLSSVIDNANDNLTALKNSLKKVTVSEQSLKSKEDEATSHLEEIKRLKTDGDADRKTIADYLAQATQQKASVQALHDEAVKLDSSVKAYQTAFDQFQKQLDEREETFTEGTANLAALIAMFEGQRTSVEELIKRSEQMLASATVSGLASNFSTMTEKLTSELWWARFAFYIGILFLTVSALPLLAFVIMPLAAPFIQFYFPGVTIPAIEIAPSGAQNGWQYLGQVLARITILLPAAWFVSFAAIRHSSLFRLREHYAYKYSMAVAVEGFKQQAPSYDQEIAALVLEQLAFNPADKLIPSKDIREGKAPGIAGYLLEKIRARVEPPLATPKAK
ncbi:hypothetical protein [Kumtagia ephedrae]|uniref:Uncharacterized protein n=1 Tax=Kumtagia ephedrae TaxID=2116701 RepID=A0A2P7SD94_9HYPH|nr:hypothetical protein [Mesorhizobium ephedrae]PSJ60469.1 hypothetical protein C7I84_10800 [Mesorhizobium ephedrae]